MTAVNDRMAEILAQYTSTVEDIESPTTPVPQENTDHRVLRPADRQRACRPPTIQGLSSATILSSTFTGSASGSTGSVFGNSASGSAKSRYVLSPANTDSR